MLVYQRVGSKKVWLDMSHISHKMDVKSREAEKWRRLFDLTSTVADLASQIDALAKKHGTFTGFK